MPVRSINAVMKVLIVQNVIPPYREAFFNQLNDKLCGHLTVCTTTANRALRCSQEVLQARRICGVFQVTRLPDDLVGESTIVVMAFDLRWGLLYQLLAKRSNQTVLWGHGYGHRGLLDWLRTALVRRSMGLIAYEPGGCQLYLRRGVPPTKLAFAGNTVEVEGHELSTRKREHFIYLGRLQPRKELEQAIRSFSMLPESLRRQARLVILGDGEIRAKLVALAVKQGVVDRCDFVAGSYNAEELKKYLDGAIAYVSPGHVGLGVLHAFACGVPVITKRSARHAPEAENIVDGVNGFLTGDDDGEVMEAMKTYLTRPDVHRSHCAAAYQRYSTHRTMPMMVERFYTALQGFRHGGEQASPFHRGCFSG